MIMICSELLRDTTSIGSLLITLTLNSEERPPRKNNEH